MARGLGVSSSGRPRQRSPQLPPSLPVALRAPNPSARRSTSPHSPQPLLSIRTVRSPGPPTGAQEPRSPTARAQAARPGWASRAAGHPTGRLPGDGFSGWDGVVVPLSLMNSGHPAYGEPDLPLPFAMTAVDSAARAPAPFSMNGRALMPSAHTHPLPTFLLAAAGCWEARPSSLILPLPTRPPTGHTTGLLSQVASGRACQGSWELGT